MFLRSIEIQENEHGKYIIDDGITYILVPIYRMKEYIKYEEGYFSFQKEVTILEQKIEALLNKVTLLESLNSFNNNIIKKVQKTYFHNRLLFTTNAIGWSIASGLLISVIAFASLNYYYNTR